MAGLVDVMLDEDAILHDRDLGPVPGLSHHHDTVHCLTASQELGFGDDRRPPPARFTPFTPPLPLGLQPGGTLDRPDVASRFLGRGPGRTDVHDGVRRVIG